MTRRGVIVLALFLLAEKSPGATLEVMPLVGYQLNGSLGLAGPVNDRMDVQNKTLRGLSIGYLTKENGEVELSWTHSNTSVEIQPAGGVPANSLDVRIDKFHFHSLYMVDPAPVQRFILLGLGATRFTPSSDQTSETRFSFAVGGGVKWLWNDYIGLRVDARWTPTVVLPHSRFFCDKDDGENCYTAETHSYLGHAFPFLNGFEFTSGLILRY